MKSINPNVNKEAELINHIINTYNKYKIVIRFLSLGKNFSIDLPSNWTFSRLTKFIKINFKDELKNNEFSFIHQAKNLNDESIFIEDLLVYTYFNYLSRVKTILMRFIRYSS